MKKIFLFMLTVAMFAAMATSAFAMSDAQKVREEQRARQQYFQAQFEKWGVYCDQEWLLPYVKQAWESGIIGNVENPYDQCSFDGSPTATRVDAWNMITALLTKDKGYNLYGIPEGRRTSRAFYEAGPDQLYNKGIVTDSMFDFPITDAAFNADIDAKRSGQEYFHLRNSEGTTTITREQFAMVLTNAAKFAGLEEKTSDVVFKDPADSFKSDEAREAAKFVTAYGFMTLEDNGNFNPKGTLTKGQVLVMTLRLHYVMPAAQVETPAQ